ncbi:hypothetical protein ES703_98568 [subsurface metagenome]
MESNNASTSRMKIIVGAITFEIEGAETLVKEGMNYAKENILTETVREIAKQLPIQGEKPPGEAIPEVPHIRDFYKQKDARNDMERVTVLVNYAREYRNMSEISDLELRPLFNQVGARLPKDLAQAIRNAARKQAGYLEYTGRKGYYRITDAGTNLVKYELPRVKGPRAQ